MMEKIRVDLSRPFKRDLRKHGYPPDKQAKAGAQCRLGGGLGSIW